MHVIEVSNGRKHPVFIEPLDKLDFKAITKRRYFFNWKLEVGHSIYKLRRKDQSDILGLMSLEYFNGESRIEIRLLAVSSENKGKGKLFERIAGSLLAYAAREAIKIYGADAAISLIPKTELIDHYKEKFGFEQAGISLFMEGKKLQDLLKTFGDD